MSGTPFDTTFDDSERPRVRHFPPSSADVYAAIASGIGLGLLAVIGILTALAWNESDRSAKGVLVLLILILNGTSFLAGLFGLFLGIRAMSYPESQPLKSYFGLFGGIFILIATSILGLVFTCIGVFLMAG